MRARLALDDEMLNACVSCGLCLPYCPTYRVSGEESASPRGRIAAMRAVVAGADADDEFVSFMEGCVQCRACEVACPSSVPFGRLMEGTRESLAPTRLRWWRRLPLAVLGRHRLLISLTTVGALAQRARVMPRPVVERLALPKLPVLQRRLVPSGDDVWLFTGCVMDAWMRETHRAVQAVIEATGAGVALPRDGGGCCGALHVHAGLPDKARGLARRVIASMPGEAPVLVDSAGCGAALKDYGHLLGTADAEDFSSRVRDVHEWLSGRLDDLPAPRPEWDARRAEIGPVGVADPCHLRNVQRAHSDVRAVLRPFVDVVELDDEGMCCGAGGAFSAIHPEIARPIRERKIAAIARSGATTVASANPGCALWLRAAGVEILHPLELVARAIGATPGS
jgi:glycolate oxidase iron-sulfur subunit